MTEDFQHINKEKVTKEELLNYSKEQLVDRIVKLKHRVDELSKAKDPTNLKEVIDKMKLQVSQLNRHENYLLYKLSKKEQENLELAAQLQELKTPTATSTQLQALLVDPAINLMFQQMKSEVDQLKSKLDQAQKDLAAWKFTPDSQAGKRLMARCRMLLQENEEQARIIATGRIAKLEGEIAMQKKLIDEMKKNSTEIEEFMAEMDEDTEANQGTIYLLQTELKDIKDQMCKFQPHETNDSTTSENNSKNCKYHDNNVNAESMKNEILNNCPNDKDKLNEVNHVNERTKFDDVQIADNSNYENKSKKMDEEIDTEDIKPLINKNELESSSIMIKSKKHENEFSDNIKNIDIYTDDQKLMTKGKIVDDQNYRNSEKYMLDSKIRTSEKHTDDFKNRTIDKDKNMHNSKNLSKSSGRDKHNDDQKSLRNKDLNDSTTRTKYELKRTEDIDKDKDRHTRTKKKKVPTATLR